MPCTFSSPPEGAAWPTPPNEGKEARGTRCGRIFDLCQLRSAASAMTFPTGVEEQGRRVAPRSSRISICSSAPISHPVESANAYVANDHPGCLPIAFLICDSCGQQLSTMSHSGVSATRRRAGFAGRR